MKSLPLKKAHTLKAIAERFVKAFDIVCAEKSLTAKEAAPLIGTTAKYISTLRKQSNPNVRADLLATMCACFNISTEWLLTGKGEMRTNPLLNKLYDSIKSIESTQEDIIEKLLDGILEIKARLSNPLKDLAEQARRRNN